MYVRTWKRLGVSITRCLVKPWSGLDGCATTRHGTKHELFLAHRNRSVHKPFLLCAKTTTSLNTSCMNMPKMHDAHGSRSIARVRGRKPVPRVPIKPPIGSVSARRNACAFARQGRGIDSVEGKRNDVGMRFVLDPNAGDGGLLIWNEQVVPAIINWRDPVVQHGLRHKIKYVRLVRRKASSPQAQGADKDGDRYYVQLVLEGHAFIKPKHEEVGKDTIGLDIGPQTLAIVPREGKADLVTFCEELAPDARKKRRLQRKMDRQRRANTPENYDEQGRVKKHGKTRLRWKESKRYKATRRQHAHTERRLAAHRKSLHGTLAHDIVKVGNTIHIEKTSFKGWQKQYGRSMGLRAPGLFVAHLRRLVAKTGGTLVEVSAFQTKLSQYCHHCGRYVKKPRSQRWHTCACGLGPVQRDLYSAFLLASLGPEQTIPSITQQVWVGAEPRLRAVMEDLQQRANEGQTLSESMGLSASRKAPRAGARRLESPAYPHQEPCFPDGEHGNVG